MTNFEEKMRGMILYLGSRPEEFLPIHEEGMRVAAQRLAEMELVEVRGDSARLTENGRNTLQTEIALLCV